MPEGGANRTIFSQGGHFGGWGLMHEGAARFVYNLVGVEVSVIDAEVPLPAGEHQVRAEFAYDGGGWPRRNRHPLLRRRADRPGHARGHHASGSAQTRRRGLATRSAPPYCRRTAPADTVFNGKISWVHLTTGQPDNSDMVDPEDVINMLMAEQYRIPSRCRIVDRDARRSPTLRICEIGGRVRLGFEGFGHVEEPTLQEAADALVAHMVRIAATPSTPAAWASERRLAPDLAALDFIWKLGEHVAAGGDPREFLFGRSI